VISFLRGVLTGMKQKDKNEDYTCRLDPLKDPNMELQRDFYKVLYDFYKVLYRDPCRE
jgi:hypothetical protein